MRLLTTVTVMTFWASAALAETVTTPPFIEAVHPMNGEVLGVAIGPGGPGVEFSSAETNGGLYRLGQTNVQIPMSDGKGLRNPTGLTVADGMIYLVDGNEILAVTAEGDVRWRVVDGREGVFLWNIELAADGRLLVSDFGNGRFVSVNRTDGAIRDFAPGLHLPTLARFTVAADAIWAITWGSDTGFDSTLYRVSQNGSDWKADAVTSGFGNAEAVALQGESILVGGYRGHETAPAARLMRVDPATGTVAGLTMGGDTQGISDIMIDGDTVYLTFPPDAKYARFPTADHK